MSINGFKSEEELKKMDLSIPQTNSYYDDEFMSLFGCLKDCELEIPDEIPREYDTAREELV